LALDRLHKRRGALVTAASALPAIPPVTLPEFPDLPNFAVINVALLSIAVLARVALPCDSGPLDPRTQIGMASVTKTSTTKSPRKEKTNFGKDKRRKHHHFLVTVYYADGEKFGRVYTDKDKADRFADRQKRSPVVKSARVTMVS
jgi:hypothetical protein